MMHHTKAAPRANSRRNSGGDEIPPGQFRLN